MRMIDLLCALANRMLIGPAPAASPSELATSPWPDLVPLPSVIARCDARSGLEHLRQDELNVRLLALYADRLLGSRDPYASDEAVARRYADGVRVKQRLKARAARLRLSARISRDRERSGYATGGVVVQMRGRS